MTTRRGWTSTRSTHSLTGGVLDTGAFPGDRRAAVREARRVVGLSHRGREMAENGAYAGLGWFLHTADAHPPHVRFGFGRPSASAMERLP
ncbi:MAG: hypothetical protein ACRDNG_07560 [Gaiellaceae bacterium]